MHARFPSLLAAAFAATALLAAPALAAPETPLVPKPAPVRPKADHWLKPPAKLPPVAKSHRATRLDTLFKALKAAPDDETAKAIEVRIWATWMVSPSDTANLLMRRVREAIQGKDLKLATKLLDAIIKIRPSYVEAWNQRATIEYKERRYGAAISDISQVLKREPRHFGALSGLGMIFQDIGDDKEALEAYRQALKIYPRLPKVPDLVKKLSQKLDGRDI
jgi:tetratricopeptide (TPR) repeat protein